MKVIVEKTSRKENLTVRLSSHLIERLEEVAASAGVSRQKLLEAILEQVLEDRSFTVKVKD